MIAVGNVIEQMFAQRQIEDVEQREAVDLVWHNTIADMERVLVQLSDCDHSILHRPGI